MRFKKQLHWPVKMAYGAAETGIVGAEVVLWVYLYKFYNEVVGLPAEWVGLALALSIIWDAFSDVLMGVISDRTAFASGRRRPYLLPGALGLALALIALFHPPEMQSIPAKFGYLLGAYLCLNTAMTVLSVPHAALGGDLSFERDERTELYGFRLLFGTFGLLIGTILPASFLRSESPSTMEVAYSREMAALWLAAPILITAFITWRATRGLDHAARKKFIWNLPEIAFTTLKSSWSTLRNGYFRPIFAAFVVAGIGRTLNSSIALYYYEYRLRISEQDTAFYILAPFFLVLIVSIGFWVWISRRFGKKKPAIIGVSILGVMTCILYPILPPGNLAGPILAAFIGGVSGGAVFLFDSMVADVVDYDELRTGENREGVYFGAWKMGQKLARALGLALTGLILPAIGIDPAQSAVTDTEAIAYLFGPGVGAFFLVAAVLAALTPLTDARHRRIQDLLFNRRQQRNVDEFA